MTGVFNHPDHAYLHGPAGCGKVDDFLTFASGFLEKLWKKTEDKMHDALDSRPTQVTAETATAPQPSGGCAVLQKGGIPPVPRTERWFEPMKVC
jgi:hypothetical protein